MLSGTMSRLPLSSWLEAIVWRFPSHNRYITQSSVVILRAGSTLQYTLPQYLRSSAKQGAAVSCVCTLRAVCVACSTCVLVLCVSYLTAAAATFLDVFKRNYLDALPRHALVTMISFSHKICVPLMLHALCYATNAAQCAHAPPCALRITTAAL
jgi:hypothetical protein